MTEESAIVFTADSFLLQILGEIMEISILKGLKKEKTLLLPLEELTPNPLQPRRRFDTEELNALCESIKVYGVIQPVAVKKIENLPQFSSIPHKRFGILK